MKTVYPVMKVPVNEKSRQWPQFLSVVTAGFLAIGAGLHFGWPSPSIPKLLAMDLEFQVNRREIAYIAMLTPIGYFVGCPASSYLLDKIGRKKTLLLISIPQIVSWILIATSSSVPMLYAARLVAGVSEGALYTSLPVYLCEVSEPKVRGVLGTTLTVGIIFGMLFINCYGSYLPIRTTAYISILVPLLFIATFIWMPESPYFYLMKGNTKSARKSLKALRRMHNVEDELYKLNYDVQRQISEPKTIKHIFAIKNNRKAFFVLIGLRTLQQFSGVSAFSVYTQVIFQQAGTGIFPATSSIIYGATQVSITCFGSVLIDRYGRRPMIILSSIGTAIVLFIEGLYFYFLHFNYDLSYFKWVPLTGMMLYLIVFSVGLGVGPNLMMGELFSASIKAKALGIMNIYFALCMSLSFKFFQEFENFFGMYVPFFFFGGCCVVGIVFTCTCIPETKGKTLEEIQEELKGSHSVKKHSITEKMQEIIS